MKQLFAIAAFALAGAGAIAAEPQTIKPTGLGPVQIGMPLAALAEALGEHLTVPVDPDEQQCFYLESEKYPGVGFMVETGRLRRIDVRIDSIPTEEGIRVGDPIAKVKALLGSRVLDEPHFYTGPEERYLTVTFDDEKLATRFETSGGLVEAFYTGEYEQVKYVEGCL